MYILPVLNVLFQKRELIVRRINIFLKIRLLLLALTSYIAQTNQQINAVISKYPCFLYFSIKAHTAELRTLGEGSSTMININKTSFEKYEIPTPSDNTLQQLEHKLSIVFSTILHNLQEIDRLNETKDLLVTQLSH